ncbi:hypothetical protein SteCoe_2389 [Stentor coeruleus]|uniref:BEACH domain-containing protein n=1 Tax=Stentor coeruleus TaxID=5963 RepID=A0A1R2CZS5_9CILI|nr:hypothetical protein SteCoe_2389 [Stentor coeruleus]
MATSKNSVLEFKHLKDTYSRWEQYENQVGNIDDFLTVVEACLRELAQTKPTKYSLNRVLADLLYWINLVSDNSWKKVSLMLRLLRELTSQGVNFQESNLRTMKGLIISVIGLISNIETFESSEVLEISFETLLTLCHLGEKIPLFSESQNFADETSTLVTKFFTTASEVISKSSSKTKYLRLYEELSEYSFFFALPGNEDVIRALDKICVANFSQDQPNEKPLCSLAKLIAKSVCYNKVYTKPQDCLKRLRNVMNDMAFDITWYYEIVLENLLLAFNNENEGKNKILDVLFEILLTENISQELYEKIFLSIISSNQPIIKGKFMETGLRIKLFESERMFISPLIFDKLCPIICERISLIELKHLLRFSFFNKKCICSILHVLLCFIQSKIPSLRYFSFPEGQFNKKKLNIGPEKKEFSIVFRFFIENIEEKQKIISIYKDSTTQVNIYTSNTKLYMNIERETETSRNDIAYIKPYQWMHVIISYGGRQKNKKTLFVKANDYEDRLSWPDLDSIFEKMSDMQIVINGKFEYFFAFNSAETCAIIKNITDHEKIISEINKSQLILDSLTLSLPFRNLKDPHKPQNLPEFTSILNGYEILIAVGGLKCMLPILKNSENILDFSEFIKIISESIDSEYYETVGSVDDDLYEGLFFLMNEQIENISQELIESFSNLTLKLIEKNRETRALNNIIENSQFWARIKENSDITHLLNIFFMFSNGTIYTNLDDIMKFFVSFIEVSAKQIAFPYIFQILSKQIVILIKNKNIELIISIIHKLAIESNIEEIQQSCTNFFDTLVLTKKRGWTTDEHIHLIDETCKIFQKAVAKNRKIDYIIFNCCLRMFLNLIKFCSFDKNLQRIFDFRTEYTRELELYNKIYSALEDCFIDKIKIKVYEDIFNFVEAWKLREFIKRVEQSKSKTHSLIGDGGYYKNFLGLITADLHNMFIKSPDCFVEVLYKIKKSMEKLRFCEVFVAFEGFPGWTYPFFSHKENENYDKFVQFTKSIFLNIEAFKNLSKLRIFIEFLSKREGYMYDLNLIEEILISKNSRKVILSKQMYFIEIMNVIEDLLVVIGINTETFNYFSSIVEILVNKYIFKSKISLNFPKIGNMQFEDFEKCRMTGDKAIMFRDGGICRQIFKFIFMLMHFEKKIIFIEWLKKICRGNKVKDDEKEWKLIKDGKKFLQSDEDNKNDKNTEDKKEIPERCTFIPEKSKKDDMLFSLYIYCESMSILETCTQFDNDFSQKLTEFFMKKKFSLIKNLKKLLSNKNFLDANEQNWKKNIEEKENKIIYPIERYRLEIDFGQIKDFYQNIKNSILKYNHSVISYLKILTIAKLDILSYRYSKLVNYFYVPTVLPKKIFKNNNPVEDYQTNETNKNDALKEKRIKRVIKKYMDIYHNDTKESEKLFSLSRFDAVGRKPFLFKGTEKFSKVSRLTSSILFMNTNRKISYSVRDTGDNTAGTRSSNYLNDIDDIPLDKEEGIMSVSTVELECELIFLYGSYYGTISLENDQIVFHSKNIKKPMNDVYFYSEETKKNEFRANSLPESQIQHDGYRFWKVADIEEIVRRRFIHVHCAVEIYFTSGKSRFINFITEHDFKKAWNKLRTYDKSGAKILTMKNLQKYQKQWKNGEISNFDYLMIVNKFAGRSYNDLSQYPVFPWILKNYTEKEINLEDKSNYRELEMPIGATDKKGQDNCSRKFEISRQEEAAPYHHGSHYSNGGIILHYLVRIEPFTRQSMSLQGGCFDVPDRLYISIKNSWESCQSFYGDCKELIPEHFYLPDMFVNVNKEMFGTRQNKVMVDNVELPDWACQSPLKFIRIHQSALESEYVSQKIGSWIDLIFGCKQRGAKALSHYNLFHPVTYEDTFKRIIKLNPANIHFPLVSQVVHFGQTPIKIFDNPHPSKEFCSTKTSLDYDIMNNNVNIIKYTVYKSKNKFFIVTTTSLIILVCIEKQDIKVTKINAKTAFDTKKKGDGDAYGNKDMYIKDVPTMIEEDMKVGIYKDEYLVTGGYEDFSIYLHTINGEVYKIIKPLKARISAMLGGCLLVIGSSDSSLYLYKNLDTVTDLVGHYSPIISICYIEVLQLIVSCSSDIILLHDYKSGYIFNRISIECTSIYCNDLGVIVAESDTSFSFFYINKTIYIRDSFEKSGKSAALIKDLLVFVNDNKVYRTDALCNSPYVCFIKEDLDLIQEVIYSSNLDLLFFLTRSDEDYRFYVMKS